MQNICCRNCHLEISSGAAKCPYCGELPGAESMEFKLMAAIVAGIGLGIILVFFAFGKYFIAEP